MKRRGVAAAAFVAVASMIVPPSPASPSPIGAGSCTPGYSYAGYAGRDGVSGVAATISASVLPLVSSGGTGWILTAFSLGLLVSIDRTQPRDAMSSSPAPLLPAAQ